MRLKKNRLKQCRLRKAVPEKDAEGNSTVKYAQAVPFLAEMWAGGGKLQAETYGMRLPNIRNLRVAGGYMEVCSAQKQIGYQVEDGPLFSAGDGICLYAAPGADPDYRIVAVYPYGHLTLEVEKI